MAYISAEGTRAIRKNLKAAFPAFKFSVRNSNHSSVNVTILSGPVRFDLTEEARRRSVNYFNAKLDEKPAYMQLNHYHTRNYENSEILESMISIINDGNHDNSDPMTDYFDVGWYVHLSMGSYDKPYVVTK